MRVVYSLENEMVLHLTQSLPEIFDVKNNYAHSTEVTEGSRIIDIVFAVFFKSNSYFSGSMKALGRLSKPQLQVLAIIWKYKKVTLNRISSLTYTDSNTIYKDYIIPLLKFNLIREMNKKSFSPFELADVVPGDIFTIEAKLSKWKEAFDQAIENKKRADYSYVAFPEGNLTLKKHICLTARSNGIGIIEVYSRIKSRIVVKAKKAQTKKNCENYIFNLNIMREALNMKKGWTLKTDLIIH